MNRNELNYSDSQLINMLYDGYGIKAIQLEFVDTGSLYAFIVNAANNGKFFLKICPKEQFLVPIQPTVESLNSMGNALSRFRNEFGMKYLAYCIPPQASDGFCYEIGTLILFVFEYIEGFHPSYSPNQLAADKLAKIFTQLHHIPADEFPCLKKENFNIEYALRLSKWLNHDIAIKDTTFAGVMLAHLNNHKEKLNMGLSKLEKLQDKYSNKTIPFVITHGDAHHYNVMQTAMDLWLVDWDDLKIGPIERDLWHYENSALIKYYCELDTQYKMDQELCKFYQLQRFFEDSHYYLEQVLLAKNVTKEQSEADKLCFLNHWGWKECLG